MLSKLLKPNQLEASKNRIIPECLSLQLELSQRLLNARPS